jgi:hypothetical protein
VLCRGSRSKGSAHCEAYLGAPWRHCDPALHDLLSPAGVKVHHQVPPVAQQAHLSRYYRVDVPKLNSTIRSLASVMSRRPRVSDTAPDSA